MRQKTFTKKSLQSVTDCYYKVFQVLQSATVITKWDVTKDNILEFKQYIKPDKMWYVIYADIESLIRKRDRCQNNPKKSSTAKIYLQ